MKYHARLTVESCLIVECTCCPFIRLLTEHVVHTSFLFKFPLLLLITDLVTDCSITGVFNHTYQVNRMIQRMRQEGAAHEKPLTPRIENLVLIDRRVDLITPLSTQLTYEGLIDELFGIKNNGANFPGWWAGKYIIDIFWIRYFPQLCSSVYLELISCSSVYYISSGFSSRTRYGLTDNNF